MRSARALEERSEGRLCGHLRVRGTSPASNRSRNVRKGARVVTAFGRTRARPARQRRQGMVIPWMKKFVVAGDAIAEVQAYEAAGGEWVVSFEGAEVTVPREVLSDTREGAAERLRMLGPVPKEIR